MRVGFRFEWRFGCRFGVGFKGKRGGAGSFPARVSIQDAGPVTKPDSYKVPLVVPATELGRVAPPVLSRIPGAVTLYV